MKYYKITHTRAEILTIYNISTNRETQKKLMSILWYYKKYYNAEKKELIYSISRLYKMYKRTHSITRSYFFTLMSKVKDAFYNGKTLVQDKLKDAKKDARSKAITTFASNIKNHNYKNNKYNTNTNVVQEIANLYKGVTGNVFATKKELKNIAKALFLAQNIQNCVVQAQVFAKINNGNRKINIAGAVNYINTLILDKLSSWDAQNLSFASSIF